MKKESSVYSFNNEKIKWLEDHGFYYAATWNGESYVFQLDDRNHHFRAEMPAEFILSKTIEELELIETALWNTARKALVEERKGYWNHGNH